MSEVTEPAAEGALPNWYDPARPLVVFVDGPRVGSWEYADHWEWLRQLAELHGEESGTGRTLAYQPVPDGKPVPHRLDSRVSGTPWRWVRPPATR